MKHIDADECTVHVLVCTNERPLPKNSCKLVGGQEFYQRIKTKLKDTGLSRTHWATRTGCLGFCNPVGTTVTIHAKGRPPRWFSEVTDADFDFIWDEIVRE